MQSPPHARPAAEVLAELDSDPDRGLTAEEADRRRRRHGANTVASEKGIEPLRILWEQLRSAVVWLLAAAAAVGFVVGETVEAIAVVVVLVVNTAVGFVTELRAAREMESLSSLLTVIAEVERDDRRDEIDATRLVPGDVVGIEAGERVPADLRLFETEDCLIDEATLTGESEPVSKGTDPVATDAPVGDRTCMAYMGTLVAAGRARGVVVGTGRDTELGKVVELTEETTERRAPMQEGLDALGRRLSVVVVAGAVLLALVGIARGRSPGEVVEVAIAIAIAVVPEGLPAVATLTLAVGMRRMARRGALVRRLGAVETLGSTTVICSDKTGTLTENRMQVTEVDAVDADEVVWRAAVLCNDADVDPDGDPVGDPTEVALLEGAEREGIEWRELRRRAPRRAEVPFDPAAKRMAVVAEDRVYTKGAPEVMIDPGTDPEMAEAAERMAASGLRVLAIGAGHPPTGDATDEALFEAAAVVGVVGLEDPPRASVVEAVQAAHGAGIRVVMITGDRPDTALAIAGRLGLRTETAVRGDELRRMDDDDLAGTVADVDVFARVDPDQKHRLVEALQQHGEVVAVTGDGVNDAPALGKADIGVAMGAGTDVAQEAADIVLTDDDFATIEAAVAEGRRVFENVRRFGQFLFSWHVAEVAVVTAALVVGFESPLTGLAILWNNLIIDVLPSFALALEPGREEVMRQPPRDPREPVINRAMTKRILLHGGLVAAVGLAAYVIASGPLALDTADTRGVVFLTLSAAQTLAVFNARTDTGSGFRGAGRNRWLWAALAVTAVLEALALTVHALRQLLGIGLPSAAGLGVALALAVVPLTVIQGARLVRGRAGR